MTRGANLAILSLLRTYLLELTGALDAAEQPGYTARLQPE